MIGKVVVSVSVPEVPVMVIVDVPAGAEQLTVIVIVMVPLVIGLGLKAKVTPLGIPDAAIVTLPPNPPMSVTVTGTVAVPHCGMDTGGETGTASAKLPVPDTVSVIEVVTGLSVPEVPVIVIG